MKIGFEFFYECTVSQMNLCGSFWTTETIKNYNHTVFSFLWSEFLIKMNLTVNSGNKSIDDFLIRTYSLKDKHKFLEWVPYENFTNIEYISEGGFSKIYRAIWARNNGESYRRKSDYVVLKVVNNSQNNEEFLKEVIIIVRPFIFKW